MDTVVKYTTATNNEYFDNGEFNFESLLTVTSKEFIADLRSKLLLSKINRLAIKQFDEESKFIYIYASHYDYIKNDNLSYMILECYYIVEGYYNIRYVSSNAIEALGLTVTQL